MTAGPNPKEIVMNGAGATIRTTMVPMTARIATSKPMVANGPASLRIIGRSPAARSRGWQARAKPWSSG